MNSFETTRKYSAIKNQTFMILVCYKFSHISIHMVNCALNTYKMPKLRVSNEIYEK